MCVNIHNLFGPFTWWPTIKWREKKRNEKKEDGENNNNNNKRIAMKMEKKRVREATIPKSNGMKEIQKKSKKIIIMFTHDQNQRCRRLNSKLYDDYCYIMLNDLLVCECIYGAELRLEFFHFLVMCINYLSVGWLIWIESNMLTQHIWLWKILYSYQWNGLLLLLLLDAIETFVTEMCACAWAMPVGNNINF